ncbi:hypothetical protein Tco_0342220, partial [Tanacetum coccineum]
FLIHFDLVTVVWSLRFVFSSMSECHCADAMADVIVNDSAEQAPAMSPPTRTDDQILPRIRWVPIEKNQLLLGC